MAQLAFAAPATPAGRAAPGLCDCPVLSGDMPDQTTGTARFAALPRDVMAVIADVRAYPEWTGAVKEVEVLSEYDDGRAREVRFLLDAGVIKDDYVLRFEWDDDREVRWSLVRGNVLRAVDGVYSLAQGGAGSTEVSYQLTMELNMPMLGMIKRKAEKVIVDTALEELRKRVEG